MRENYRYSDQFESNGIYAKPVGLVNVDEPDDFSTIMIISFRGLLSDPSHFFSNASEWTDKGWNIDEYMANWNTWIFSANELLEPT